MVSACMAHAGWGSPPLQGLSACLPYAGPTRADLSRAGCPACRMLLGLPPARYVVLPQYEAKLKQLLETANDMDAGLPLEYEITTLEVRVCTRHT